MTQRITNLMDDYQDTHMVLPKADYPTADRTKELTMKKIKQNKSRRLPRVALIAACLALALSVTAGAVGYTLWDAARNDLGITEDIPEYTEYTDAVTVSPEVTEESQELVEGAEVTLVSALCTGNQVTAYLSVFPVTQEMTEVAETLDTFALWETGYVLQAEGIDQLDGASMGCTQVEYDPDTQTALIRLELSDTAFGEAASVTTGIVWHHEAQGSLEEKYYGTVTIPITQSQALYAAPELPVENTFLASATGTVSQVEVRAGYIAVALEITPFETFCEALGADAYFTIGDAYWNYYHALNGRDLDTEFDELDARVAYERAWNVTLSTLMEDATLTMQDGTTVSISALESLTTAGWNPVDGTDTEGSLTFSYDLKSPLELAQVESITIAGTSYSLS